MITDVLSIIGVTISLYSIYRKDYYILIFGRVIAGFNCGMNSVLVPLYIKEMSPDAIS